MALNVCLSTTTHHLVTDAARCDHFCVSTDSTDDVQTCVINQYSEINVMQIYSVN
jgi:hypothetical protein